MPALRPLVLVLKALLREHRLNVVWHGGLSSFSLLNMAREGLGLFGKAWEGLGFV